MVKGVTRQVIVVKGPDPKLFDEAIFLVRDSVLSEGGITEEALLQEARLACKSKDMSASWFSRLLWAGAGAGLMAFIWILTLI